MNTCEYLLRMIVPWSNLRQNWEIQHYTIQDRVVGMQTCKIQIDECSLALWVLNVWKRHKKLSRFEFKYCWALSEYPIFYIPLHVFAIISMQHEVGGTAGCISVCSISGVLQCCSAAVGSLVRGGDLCWPSANVFIPLAPASARPGCKPINLYSFTTAAVWAERREYGSPFLKPTG